MQRAAINPPATPQAIHDSVRFSSVLRRIEQERRAEELTKLRDQIEQIRMEIHVVERDPYARPGHLAALRGVLRRAKAFYVRLSTEVRP